MIVSDAVAERLGVYLDLLSFWNARTNLTSLDLSGDVDAAVERLILEPLEASRLVRPVDRCGVDIGSGGGSPALPLMICSPHLEMVLIEVRARKAAFLREALRTLNLNGRVEQSRAEEVEFAAASLVSLRAVRADHGIWDAIDRFLAPDGRFFWFGAPPDASSADKRFAPVESHDAVTVLERRPSEGDGSSFAATANPNGLPR